MAPRWRDRNSDPAAVRAARRGRPTERVTDNGGELAVQALASGGTMMTGTGTTAHEVPANATAPAR
jgi:hypothetical protein